MKRKTILLHSLLALHCFLAVVPRYWTLVGRNQPKPEKLWTTQKLPEMCLVIF